MNNIDATPVVLGLYRHAARGENTLRCLLQWLKEDSCLETTISSQSSVQDAQDLLKDLHIREALSGRRPNPAELIKLMFAGPAPPCMDDALIDHVVGGNDRFPRRVRLRCIHLPDCPVAVGYADPMPDDFRESGRRMIQVAASPAETLWSKVPPGAKLPFQRVEPWAVPSWLMIHLEEFLRHMGESVPFDYATIQHGRELPDPTALLRSTESEDFDRLYISLPATESQRLVAEFDDAHDLRLDLLVGMRLIPQVTLGVVAKLHDAAEPLSRRGQELMSRLREILQRRFEIVSRGQTPGDSLKWPA